MMAVPMNNRFGGQCWNFKTGRFLFQELCPREYLLLQAFGIFIIWKKIDEFIPENGNATGFQTTRFQRESFVILR